MRCLGDWRYDQSEKTNRHGSHTESDLNEGRNKCWQLESIDLHLSPHTVNKDSRQSQGGMGCSNTENAQETTELSHIRTSPFNSQQIRSGVNDTHATTEQHVVL